MNLRFLLVIAALAALLLSCTRTPDASPRTPAPGLAGGPCGSDFGTSPFQNQNATHLLVADFFPHREKDRAHVEFADDVTVQVDKELKRFREEVLQNPKVFDIDVPTGALEVGRLRCFLDSHEQAKAAAKALGADVVIWGRAYCQGRGENGTPGPIEVNVQVGEIHTGDQSPVNVGNVTVPEPKPYAVCPSATLSLEERALRQSDEHALRLGGVSELDLPRLTSAKPFMLVHFALGDALLRA